MKIIVAGAGIAGMAAAIRLQKEGFQVSVFEQQNNPGGKLGEISGNGYRFDSGPSLFTMPHYVNEILSEANKLPYKKLNVLCNYYYADGEYFSAPGEQDEFIKKAGQFWNIDESGIRKHFEENKRIYDITSPVFLESSLHKLSTYTRPSGIKGILNLWRINMARSMNAVNRSHFSNPKAVQYFNRYATYNGSNPWKAPATLNVISHLESGIGAFYPEGGMIAIPCRLHKEATEAGVTFHFGQKIDAILHNQSKVTGIKTADGKIHDCDMLVSNLDVRVTGKLAQIEIPKRVAKSEPSSSALIFYWGIKKEFPTLDLHNIFFSADYEEEFRCLFETGTITQDPTVYVNISSKYDRNDAPEGCENWFVMINAPANRGQNWDKLKAQARASIISKLSHLLQTDIEALIAFEDVLDPVEIEKRTGSRFGSLYGSSSNNRMSAFFRQANFSSQLKGLYYCGGSVHPGGGIPLCLLSAKISSELITGKYGKKR